MDVEKFKEIIVERLGVDPNEITDDASFVDDLGADSLDTVELVATGPMANSSTPIDMLARYTFPSRSNPTTGSPPEIISSGR